MKPIANQYRDLLEGKMSKANFMASARHQFPDYISPVNNFEDMVSILKNKRILSENDDDLPASYRMYNSDDWVDAQRDAEGYDDVETKWKKLGINTVDSILAAVGISDQETREILGGYDYDTMINRLPDFVDASEVDNYINNPPSDYSMKRGMGEDIEVAADEWERQQQIQAELNREELAAATRVAREAGSYLEALQKLKEMGLDDEQAGIIATDLYSRETPEDGDYEDTGEWKDAMYEAVGEVITPEIEKALSQLDPEEAQTLLLWVKKKVASMLQKPDTSNEIDPYFTGQKAPHDYGHIFQEDSMSGEVNDRLEAAKKEAREESENGYVQHVNKSKDGYYYVSDWYDGDETVASYEDGERLNESRNSLNEALDKLEGKYKDVTGKKQYSMFDEIDRVNPYEFKKGVAIEMGMQYLPTPNTFTDKFNPDALRKAGKKVLKNLAKDPAYYTNAISAATEKRTNMLQKPKEEKVKADGMMKIKGFNGNSSNTETNLGKREAAKGKPEGVKEMKPSRRSMGGIKTMKSNGKVPKGVTMMNEGKMDDLAAKWSTMSKEEKEKLLGNKQIPDPKDNKKSVALKSYASTEWKKLPAQALTALTGWKPENKKTKATAPKKSLDEFKANLTAALIKELSKKK